MLCEDLRQWGIGNPTETFQSPLYPESGGTSADYVVQAVENSPGQEFGFKISWEQAHTLCSRLDDEGDGNSSDTFDLRRIFPSLRFVHIVRRDKVAQAVSAWRAYRSDVWHKPTMEVDVDAGHFDYDFAGIREQLLQVLADDWVWSSHFESLGINCFQVAYEDYVATRAATLRSLAGFLGAPVANTELVDHTRTMRDEWSREMVERTWADLHAPGHPIWTAFPVRRNQTQST